MSFLEAGRPLSAFTPPASLYPIRAGFCSHNRAGGRPGVWYDPEGFPFLWWQWQVLGLESAHAELDETLAMKRRAGQTHVVADCPDGSKYQAVGLDWIASLPNWMDDPDAQFFPMCAYLRAAGFTLIWYIYGGGPDDVPKIYNGDLASWVSRWNAQDFAQTSIRLWAWETFGRHGTEPPPFTARQNSDAWTAIGKDLPATSAIAAHIQPCYRLTWYPNPWEDDCPVVHVEQGSEREAWYTNRNANQPDAGGPAGGMLPAIFFAQFDPDDVNNPAEYLSQYQQDQDRCLPLGTLLPNGHVTIGPDWFTEPRTAGRLRFCGWEPGIPFLKCRNEISDQLIVEINANLMDLGIVDLGCMPAV